jgi:hypothetical protein
MSGLARVLATAAACALLAGGCATPPLPTEPTIYVSPQGNDAWSGTQRQPSQAGNDGPLASVSKAVAAARALRPPGAPRVHVVFAPGYYSLDHTIELGPADSGLSLEGSPDNAVVLSGGRRIRGWTPWKGRILQAPLPADAVPDLGFRELYYADRLMTWARVPNADPEHPRTGGFLQNAAVAAADTKTVFVYPEGALRPESWAHPERAWIQFHDSLNYETQYCPLRAVDATTRTLTAERGVYVLGKGNPFFLCGLLEELDAPGEWCVDPDRRVLYFWPPAGNPNGHDQVVVPVLTSAFVLTGDVASAAWVDDVRLDRLAIRACRGRAIAARGARRLAVTACDLRHAEVGVYLGDDTHACRVVGCDITATQGDGISILGSSQDHERVSDHAIDNNHIWDIGWGRIHNRCGGVYMHRVSRCRITRNLIHDTPRYAIGMDVGGDCEIAYNHAHHANLVTQDTSIIEAATALDWGLPMAEQMARNRQWNWNNSIHHNRIHDSGGWGTDAQGQLRTPQYSWGIYLDTHSSGWQVHDNVIYNTVLGAYMVNGGMENAFTNNVCVDGQENQAYLSVWPKYQTTGNQVARNLFVAPGGTSNLYTVRKADREGYAFDSNLVWAGGDAPRVNGVAGLSRRDSWGGWLKLGQDQRSLVADPQFVNPARRDYRLKPTSPAFGLGCKAIALSAAGLYASPERRTWPCRETTVRRDATSYAPATVAAPAQPVLRTYEDAPVGAGETGAHGGNKGGATAAVTDETAAGGTRSLKFSDAAGTEQSFFPYVTYPLELEQGTLRLDFDLRWESGGMLALDWRDDPYAFNMGPNLTTTADGWLSANGLKLLQLPAGHWLHVEILCHLGDRANGTYDLTLTLPGATPQVYKALACSPLFTTLNCVVFMGVAEAPGIFYIDNLAFVPGAAKP